MVLGLEAGIGGPTGTSAEVYGTGRGVGLIVGYRYDRMSLEAHLLENFALPPKHEELRGESTYGTLTASCALFGFRLLDRPLLSVMAGPAMLSTPVLVVTTAMSGIDPDAQVIEAREVRGVGAIVGGSAGWRLTPSLAISLDLRFVLAAKWETANLEYVVPGMQTPSGGREYTVSVGDISGSAWSATVALRLLL